MKIFTYIVLMLSTVSCFVNATPDVRTTSKDIQQQQMALLSSFLVTGMLGTYLTVKGVLTLLDIPTTTLDTIALAMRQKMDARNQEKQKIGSCLVGYTCTIVGLAALAVSYACAYQYSAIQPAH